MKKILLTLFIITVFGSAFAQVGVYRPFRTPGTYIVDDEALRVGKILFIPHATSQTLNGSVDSVGLLIANTTDTSLNVRWNGYWQSYPNKTWIQNWLNSKQSASGALTGFIQNQNSAAQASSNLWVSGQASANTFISYVSSPGANYNMILRNSAATTPTTNKFGFILINTETGSNAGSDLRLDRISDTNTNLGSIFTITRSTGILNFTSIPTIGGTPVWYSSNHAAGSAFSLTTPTATIISTLTTNASGHVTGATTRSLTAYDFPAGSTLYIQNQNAGAQSANIWTTGSVRFDLSSDAKWDTWYRDSTTNSFTRLPAGTFGQIYTAGPGGKPQWSNISGIVNNEFPNLIGSIYNKSSFSNTSDFVSNGTITASASGGAINISTTDIATIHNSLDLPSNSLLQYWKIKVIYVVNTALSGTSHGIGVGIHSTNTHVTSSVAGYVDLSTDVTYGRRAQIANTYPTDFTIVSTSGDQLSYSVGDTLETDFERQGNIFTVSGRNITTQSPSVTSSYTFSTSNTLQNMANTGRFCIYAFGGSYSVLSFNVASKEIKNPDLMLIGDSKTVGYTADYKSSFANLLRTSVGSVVTSAGGGDRTSDVMSRLNEIKSINPKNIAIEIGTNDPDSVTYKSNYQSLVSSLTGSGFKVYHMSFYQSGNDWRNNFLKRTYPDSTIINTWDATRYPLALGPDNVHLSNLGDSLVYSEIINSGKISLRGKSYTPSITVDGKVNFLSKFNEQNTLSNSVLYDDGKNVGLGISSPTGPTGSAVLQIHDISAGSSPTIHMTNGDIGAGAGAGTAIFVGNAASTGSGSFNIYNMDATGGIHLYTASTNRMSILSSGNVGIGTVSPTEKLVVNGNIIASAPAYSSGGISALGKNNTSNRLETYTISTPTLDQVTTAGNTTSNVVNVGALGVSSTAVLGGAVYYATKTVTATYSILVSDHVIFVNNSSAATLTLPSATGLDGITYYIKKIANNMNNVTLATTGGQTIDDASTANISYNASLQVIATNGNWKIL